MTKIIIVEDDPMILEIYQKKFSEAGFEVFSAESGDQALNIAKKESVDLVLSDLIMPKMDGFEVIKQLRTSGYDSNIKIIISSNLSQKEDRERAMQLGANGFIVKSDFSPTDLVNEVKRLSGQYQEREKNLNKAGEEPADVAKSGAKKILMIEDEEIFVEMFGDKLKQDGFDVSFARNGAWGVKKAQKGDFDLFIIDMVMPAMTGEEMIEKLKMEDNTKDKPIIVLSASVEDGPVKRVEEMGINAFFVKTQVTPSELSNKVAELVS